MIGIVMGSANDWEVMKAAAKTLEEFGIAYDAKAISAHRTPHAVGEWAEGAAKRGLKAIIAAAGG
ncbi:MAG: AIR carboxylase family protein, partial [Burkholderiales bacterium]